MQIFAIYSLLNDQFIGKDNDLLIKDKNDLQHFKEETFNRTLIMGRKTVESLPKKLKNRTIIMLTTNPLYIHHSNLDMHADFVVRSPHEAIKLAYDLGVSKLYIAGGASIYDTFSSILDGIIETNFYKSDFDHNQDNLISLPTSIIDWKKRDFTFRDCKDLRSCTVNYFIK